MKTLYACGVDWQHEIGEAGDLEGNMPLYSSVKELKSQRSCWKECGIVELRIELIGWYKSQKLFKKAPNRKGKSK